MKKILYILIALFATTSLSSCLKSDLEDLDTYSGCDITAMEIYYRYVSNDIIPGSNQPKVIQKKISRTAPAIDKEAGTISIKYLMQSNFTAEEKANFKVSEAVVTLDISTAATIRPLDGSAALGVPADWSKPNQYEVTAANGDKKVWTVSVALYQ